MTAVIYYHWVVKTFEIEYDWLYSGIWQTFEVKFVVWAIEYIYSAIDLACRDGED